MASTPDPTLTEKLDPTARLAQAREYVAGRVADYRQHLRDIVDGGDATLDLVLDDLAELQRILDGGSVS